MKQTKWYTHLGIIIGMLVVACVYMSPALSGKQIAQGDVQKADAMVHAQRIEYEQTGEAPDWNPTMFGGMPNYYGQQHSAIQPIRNLLIMRPFGVERNIAIIFLYLLGFYVALLAFGLSPWLAVVGALGFGFASYNIIIIEAGHITKAWAMSMMAPILAGMWLVLHSVLSEENKSKKARRQLLWGVILFTLSLALQISFNHIQITYYTAIACIFMGIAYAVVALRSKCFGRMAGRVGILIVGAALAFGSNAALLLGNEQYSHYTMRGGNELTVTPSDLYGDAPLSASESNATGLDIDYAFNWSYGIGETYTLLVPGARGGGSGERVGKESAFYKTFRSEQAPLYWGDQPFTSGPVYFGAIIIFLFLLGMLVVKGAERWWLLATSLLAILLAWGSNLMPFNEWIFTHLPYYNKFRTPSMALVLANACMALMAALTLKHIFQGERTEAERRAINRGLYISAGALVAVILGVLVFSGSSAFSGAADRQMEAQYGSQWQQIYDVLVQDRRALLRSDSWRSILFIVLAAVVLWLYNNKKLRQSTIAIALIGVLVLVDLWGIDRRYLNDDNFVEARRLELRRDQYDFAIDEQATAYGDHDYRVFNLAVNTYNDSKPSAFHDQVGGYSPVKLSRYQNMIDFYLSRHISPQVLNMLNTRYIVLQNGQVQRNPDAYGNAWFVREVKPVASANEEILALNQVDLQQVAVIDTTKFHLQGSYHGLADSTATISLQPEKPRRSNRLRYQSHTAAPALAVLSEVYYGPDWRAYIDGKPASYVRVNYILRAIEVPTGDHTIDFRDEAPRRQQLNRITLIVSILTLLAMVAAGVAVYMPRRKKETSIQ